ncbi:hypothetical protein HMPREF1628_01585 [Actinomyces sp. S4-C9]|nr:hypothetical protein HMPREF1628_01585 [Actinomyces sp. S4-C9]
MRVLHYYPNLTQGGMGTVLRTRAKNLPSHKFDLLFSNDSGGGNIFDELPNVEFRLVRKERLENYLTFTLSQRRYDEVIFTSAPEIANKVFESLPLALRVYEFHSSDVRVLSSEVEKLDLRRVDEVRVPSDYLAGIIQSLLPANAQRLVRVVPNQVDEDMFFVDKHEHGIDLSPTLIWVGQFSRAKGYNDFLRVLGNLPENYAGEMYFSGRVPAEMVVGLMAEIARSGVQDRVSIFYNVPQQELAKRYRELGDSAVLVSTSLLESFGYGVYEALKCGLRCAVYELPALNAFHEEFPGMISTAPLGEISALAESILQMHTA